MRLRKGDLVLQTLNRKIGGLLLYRKNDRWHYALTSPSKENEARHVTSIQTFDTRMMKRALEAGDILLFRKGVQIGG